MARKIHDAEDAQFFEDETDGKRIDEAASAGAAEWTEPDAAGDPVAAAPLPSPVLLRILQDIPGLRCMPVVDKRPVYKGWTDEAFWTRPILDRVQAWNAPDHAFVLGPRCGPGGNIVVEADNLAGERWVGSYVGMSTVMTVTRHGFFHRHFACDVENRGNYIDVLGSKAIWREAATKAGYQVTYDRQLCRDDEHIAHVDAQRALALQEIPMGPLVDIKGANGQIMCPGSTHPTGYVYTEWQPWTRAAWDARPVFDATWFPEGMLDRAPPLSADEASDASTFDAYWTEARRVERAWRYIRKQGPVRRNTGTGAASDTFMGIAGVVVRGFATPIGAAREMLTWWATSVCGPGVWNAREIEHKLKSAHDKSGLAMGCCLSDPMTTQEGRALATRAAVLRDKGEFELPAHVSAAQGQEADEVLPPDDVDDQELKVKKPEIHLSMEVARRTPPDNTATDTLRDIFASYLMNYGEVYADHREQEVIIQYDKERMPVGLQPVTNNLVLLLTYSEPFRGRVRLNQLTQKFELDDEPIIDWSSVLLRLNQMFGQELAERRVEIACLTVARANAYHPVAEWLAELPTWDGVQRLDSAARNSFGAATQQDAVYLKKTMLGAVARALRPGIEQQTMYILQSDQQGLYKSRFFRVLFGAPWTSDQPIKIGDKDSILQMNSYWCLEVAEVDKILRPHTISEIKHLLSGATDDVRAPYGRQSQKIPRRCILVGTSNERRLLHDPTGDRRFWISSISKAVNLGWVKENRDQLWAEAYALTQAFLAVEFQPEHPDHQAGMYWLTPEEDEVRADGNQGYQSEDTIEDAVYGFLDKQGRRLFLQQHVMDYLQARDIHDHAMNRRVTSVLVKLKCSKQHEGRPFRHDGKLGRWWAPPEKTAHEEEREAAGLDPEEPPWTH